MAAIFELEQMIKQHNYYYCQHWIVVIKFHPLVFIVSFFLFLFFFFCLSVKPLMSCFEHWLDPLLMPFGYLIIKKDLYRLICILKTQKINMWISLSLNPDSFIERHDMAPFANLISTNRLKGHWISPCHIQNRCMNGSIFDYTIDIDFKLKILFQFIGYFLDVMKLG